MDTITAIKIWTMTIVWMANRVPAIVILYSLIQAIWVVVDFLVYKELLKLVVIDTKRVPTKLTFLVLVVFEKVKDERLHTHTELRF